MSVVLNNITTEDDYAEETTLEGGGECARVEIDVYNAGIYLQLKLGQDEATARWQPERFIAPEGRIIDRRWIWGARVRSALAGVPAQVTLELVNRRDAPYPINGDPLQP